MKVLITGAMGFIGAHLVDYILQNTDWSIVTLDRLDTSGNPNRLAAIPSWATEGHRVKTVYWDLKSPVNDQCAKQLGTDYDHIIHLAASSHVDRSIEDPLLFAMDNVVGTTNLLTWAKGPGRTFAGLGGLKLGGKIINFGTDEVFGPAPVGYAHKESDAFRPSNPYSASKAGAASMGFAFFVTYGLPVINTYTMNNFGERQHPEKLLPKTIRSVINQTPMPIFAKLNDEGKLEAVGSRYWLHCANTAHAVLFLLEKGIPGEGYNIIGFDEYSNLEMAEKIAAIIGKPLIPEFVDFHATRPGHDMRYALDGTKMKELGWEPPVSFDEGLRRTVQYSLDNPEWQ